MPCSKKRENIKIITNYDIFKSNDFFNLINNCHNFQEFINIFTDTLKTAKKEIKFSSRNFIRKPYITPETLKLIKAKNKLFKLHKKFPLSDFYQEKYYQARNILSNKIKRERINYYTNLIMSNLTNLKKAWQIMGEIVFKKSPNSKTKKIILQKDGLKIGDPKECGNIFNDYFVNITDTVISLLLSITVI